MQAPKQWRKILKIFGQPAHSRHSHSDLPASYLNHGTVYIHWPYCRQRCTYCNFVKFIPRPKSAWSLQSDVLEDAMVKELQNCLQQSHITLVKSIFFGGGTPSLAQPQLVEKILNTIGKHCNIEEKAEITLEVNPTLEETQKLPDFVSAGVNRVSVGLQALNDIDLKFFNRDHCVAEALNCIDISRKLLPGRVSLDLIFGRPGQSVQSWKKELHAALQMSDDHLSLYQLTVERGTKLHQQVLSGEVLMPEDDVMAELYEAAVSALSESGYARYEVSNFARGYQAESVHNKMYWRSSQYIGIGPGAHSRLAIKDISKPQNDNAEIAADGIQDLLTGGYCRTGSVNAADPASWLYEVNLKGTGKRSLIFQTRFDILLEYVASALRTHQGIKADIWKIFCPWKTHTEVFFDGTLWLQECNLLKVSDEHIRVTDQGLSILDSILPHLVIILEKELSNN